MSQSATLRYFFLHNVITFRCNLAAVMEDKRGLRFSGSKVSEIANRFQAKPPLTEEIIAPLKPKKVSSSSHEEDSSDVTVIRTESHVTRFNNARALFEKLGEENRNNREKFIPLQSTKSASDICDSRSRSSHDDNTETTRHIRSISPNQKRLVGIQSENLNLKTNNLEDNLIKTNGNQQRSKPVKPEKPEKPQRKFNSKELIEKQRNWTSHFSKSRTARYNSDPNKTEVKLVVNNGDTDTSYEHKAASRSASFNNRFTTSTSPVANENFRRNDVSRKERPASVIPTVYNNNNETSPATSPTKVVPCQDVPKRRERTSLILVSSDTKTTDSGSYAPVVSPREFRILADSENTESKKRKVTETGEANFLLPSEVNSALDNKDVSRENLSATSGSLSSLSPPSSPGKLKSEIEKQEDEGNEKSSICKYRHVCYLI